LHEPLEETVDFGLRFRVEAPAHGLPLCGVAEQAALLEQVFFDRQESIKSPCTCVDSARAFEDASLAAGGIAEPGKIRAEGPRFGLEEDVNGVWRTGSTLWSNSSLGTGIADRVGLAIQYSLLSPT
jgi:hypothetical protein